MLRQSRVILALLLLSPALACNSVDSPTPTGAAGKRLGIHAYEGTVADDEIVYELFDENERSIGRLVWTDEGPRETTSLELLERDYDFTIESGSSLALAVDDVQLASFATTGAQHYEGPDAESVREALDVLTAVQEEFGLGALDPAGGESEYSYRICFSVTILGYTYEYCIESPPPCVEQSYVLMCS